MDNDYLYVVGALALIAVFFIFFIYFKSRDSDKNEGLENSKMEQHIAIDHQVECDGDKCFIKHKETKQ
jgi:Na+/H+ antiporter NhaD/arsenite permease-like protein